MTTTTTAQANRDYNAGRLGWYVVNHITDIAVSGPHASRVMAEADRRQRNAIWPDQSQVDLMLIHHDA